jgi:hypothetical protein
MKHYYFWHYQEVEQGQLLTMDEDEVMEQARRHASALIERAGIEIVPKWPVL